MSETRLRYVLIRVKSVSDVDVSLIASKIEAKEDSAGMHPVLLFRAYRSEGDYAAIVGTTDREGKRLTDPYRCHTALASSTHYNFRRPQKSLGWKPKPKQGCSKIT